MLSPHLVLTPTRESLHRLAEHVVSPCRHAVTGRIGLRPRAGGLGTPPFGPLDTVVAVELDEIVVVDRDGVRRTRATSLRQAGEFAGVTPGAPVDVYSPATPCDLDAPLTFEPDAMRVIADWYAVGAHALSALGRDCAAESPTEPQLWPEHLDLASTVSQVNFGFSPGDAQIHEPYLYVGPSSGRPRVDAFWNTDFGAARTASHIGDAAGAVAFFHEARERLSASPLANERALS